MKRLALALLISFITMGHSWYDGYCCQETDCQPIEKTSQYGNKMVYHTQFGQHMVDNDTSIRDSKDNQTHACIYQNKLRCLYVPPSN